MSRVLFLTGFQHALCSSSLLLFMSFSFQDHPFKQICRHLSLYTAASLHYIFSYYSTTQTFFLKRSSHRKRGLFRIGYFLVIFFNKRTLFFQAWLAHINLLLVFWNKFFSFLLLITHSLESKSIHMTYILWFINSS